MHYFIEIFIYSILTPALSLQVFKEQDNHNVLDFERRSEWEDVKRRIITENRHETFNDALKKYSLRLDPNAGYSLRQSVSDSIVPKLDTTNTDVGNVDYISSRLRNLNPDSNRRLVDYVDGPVIVPNEKDLKEFMGNMIRDYITPELEQTMPAVQEAIDQVKDDAPGIRPVLKDMKNYTTNIVQRILQKQMGLSDSMVSDIMSKQNDQNRKFNKYNMMNKIGISSLDESPKTYFEATRRHRFFRNHPNLYAINTRRLNKDAPLIGYDMNINQPRRLIMRRFNSDGMEIPFSEKVLKKQVDKNHGIAEATGDGNQSNRIETKITQDSVNTTELLKNRTKRYVNQDVEPRRMRRFNMDNVEIPYSGETLVNSYVNASRRSFYEPIAYKTESNRPQPLRMRRFNTRGEELSYDKEDGVPKKRLKRMNMFEEEFAYHDKMESAGAGDVETYEKNLKAYEKHGGKYRRSSFDGKPKLEENYLIDKDKAQLLNYAVPVSMKIAGYIQVP